MHLVFHGAGRGIDSLASQAHPSGGSLRSPSVGRLRRPRFKPPSALRTLSPRTKNGPARGPFFCSLVPEEGFEPPDLLITNHDIYCFRRVQYVSSYCFY